MLGTFRTKSALSWFGSDSQVAERLGAMLDHCSHVTIPFLGGAAMLPHLKAGTIAANDKHALAINFYRHASGSKGAGSQKRLIARCQTTLSHPAELALASEWMSQKYRGTSKQAWAFWAMCWIGRKGKGGTRDIGGKASVRRTTRGGNNASRLRSVIEDLPRWVKQFERCEWESVCFRDLLPKVVDCKKNGIYGDPPWVGAGKRFIHPFAEEDHVDLAAALHRFQHTTVVVRYGDDPLIRDLYRDWEIIKASSKTQSGGSTPEIWLRNQCPMGA